MSNPAEFWNQRYAQHDYIYGTEPNHFFASQLQTIQLNVGKALFPAEGEGRNAVFAARLGWQVTAFDSSEEAKKKAERLALSKQVQLDYHVQLIEEASFPIEHFDLIVLIFVHLPEEKRIQLHKNCVAWLKPGGLLILEAFHPKHLHFQRENPRVGGPSTTALLYTLEQLQADFNLLEPIHVAEEETVLNEGDYHSGQSAVVRFVGRKW
jgi:SAM-dependent methyltransferase